MGCHIHLRNVESKQYRDLGDTTGTHIYGLRKFENKHGVGILVNKKNSERAISMSITVNKQQILMMSVYFSHSGYADHHVEKMYRSIEKHTKSKKKNMKIVGGDFNAELGPGDGVERVRVGPHTHSTRETREDTG